MSYNKKRGRSEEEIISVDSSCEESIKTKIDAFLDACEMIEDIKTDEIVDRLSIFISRWRDEEVDILFKYYEEKMSDLSSEEALSKENLTKAKEEIRTNNEASSFYSSVFIAGELDKMTTMNAEELNAADKCLVYLRQKIRHIKRYNRSMNPEIKRDAIVCNAVAKLRTISKPNLERGVSLSPERDDEDDDDDTLPKSKGLSSFIRPFLERMGRTK
jgi:hypothetical protein